MPFDPTLPQAGTPVDADQIRAQLTALNDDIQTRATSADLAAVIAGTSSNSNAVATLAQNAQPSYDQNQMQAVLDKIDELINALRR